MGTECEDRATKLKGTITHWCMNMAGHVTYLFQPKGLNPETGKPVSRIYMPIERLIVPKGGLESTDVPFEILGSQVTDEATGFTGMAISFIRHRNGCFHVDIQPEGVLPKTNSPVDSTEFDIRGCVGPNVPKWSEEEIRESERRQPSPIGDGISPNPFDGKTGD